MKITKKFLTNLERCYAAASTVVDGERRIMLATEGEGACYQFRGENFSQSIVWDKPGGTMSIVPIPGKNGDFLAVQNFFPTFQAEKATIVWGEPQADGTWEIHSFIKLPYVHRFDLIRVNGVNYFLGATLANSKRDKEDWSDPGQIWVGILPDSPEKTMELESIKEGLVRNHGYCRIVWGGKEAGFVTADNGAFVVTPPQHSGEAWSVETVFNRPISDVAVCDIDNDGELEIMTLEPFHGNTIAINKKIDGEYRVVWQYDKPVDFAHAVWGGKLRGIPTFLCGYRKEAAELFYVQCESKKTLRFKSEVIESGIGPSNIAVLHEPERDIIISANRMLGEAALYIVTD